VSIDRSDVEELAQVRADPAVSILLPVRRAVPVHVGDRLRLRELVKQAVTMTEHLYGSEVASTIGESLDALADQVDLAHVGDGLALFATADSAGRVYPLPFTVSEQVAIDNTFATRQLLAGLARHPRHRVLVLSRHENRLFLSRGDQLIEVTTDGFPVTVQPPHEWDTPHRDQPIHESLEDEEHRFVLRAVDQALGRVVAKEPLPLVVTGTPRELAFYDEVTRQGMTIIGRVEGDYTKAGPADLAVRVRPVIDQHLADRRHQAVASLSDAVGRGHAVIGPDEVHRAALAGRGHVLVVEEDFEFPTHMIDGFTAGTEPEPPLVIDDLVDEIVDEVLLARGDVVFVAPGALEEFDRIGLITRY